MGVEEAARQPGDVTVPWETDPNVDGFRSPDQDDATLLVGPDNSGEYSQVDDSPPAPEYLPGVGRVGTFTADHVNGNLGASDTRQPPTSDTHGPEQIGALPARWQILTLGRDIINTRHRAGSQ